MSKESAGIGSVAQYTSASTSAVPLAMAVEMPMDVATSEGMESELAMASGSPPPSPASIYATLVSSYEVPSLLTLSHGTISKCKAIFPNPAIRLYAMSQGPHPSSRSTNCYRTIEDEREFAHLNFNCDPYPSFQYGPQLQRYGVLEENIGRLTRNPKDFFV